ncbi:hypothetical protein [Chitinophaga sp. Cy-1792]|uniref:hypothetical protein n=1 Tax=Chitinophaga sp. Cy-1792 TaxID=2608339 RepID=UPI0019635962|nr:hypothetical protein [Chitinophaga sp. Cy-1792]
MGSFRNKSKGKIALMILCGLAFVTAVVFLTMTLWNWLIPELFHGPTISFWQAFGLLLLGKLLFGWHSNGKGFGGGHSQRDWRAKIRNKWEHMSPEEQAQFKEKLRNRCGGSERFERFSRFWDEEKPSEEVPPQQP